MTLVSLSCLSRAPGALLRIAGLLAVLAVLAARPSAAQVQPPRDTAAARPPAAPPAATPAPATAADTVPRISPGGAFVRSLILPGWGQSAIGSPGRGSIYFAMEAGSLWMVLKSRQKLRDARVRERYLRDTGRLTDDQDSGRVNAREEQLEDWITLSAFLLLFNAADAFVAAHLVDFDERIRALPTLGGGVQLQASVPVGRRP
ncbi:MAG TPA: hypothetical protein VHG28_04185 [Longimicrobiaceae bacterium]|nr:hypothetical protein [Longimicrobiaceae bacterium]